MVYTNYLDSVLLHAAINTNQHESKGGSDHASIGARGGKRLSFVCKTNLPRLRLVYPKRGWLPAPIPIHKP